MENYKIEGESLFKLPLKTTKFPQNPQKTPQHFSPAAGFHFPQIFVGHLGHEKKNYSLWENGFPASNLGESILQFVVYPWLEKYMIDNTLYYI